MYSDQDIANLVARVQQLEILTATRPTSSLPNIKMLSPNFLTRAFAVWGNNFVASLLISIALSCVMTIIGLLLGTTLINWISQMLQSFQGSM